MGFSPWGLLVGLAVLAPNLLIVWFPPRTPVPAVRVPRPVGWLERSGQVLCLVVPAITRPGEPDRWWALVVLGAVTGYYVLWVRYLCSGRVWVALYRPWLVVPVPMAVLPVVAFLATAAWLSNAWIAVAAVVLAAGHVPAAVLVARAVRHGDRVGAEYHRGVTSPDRWQAQLLALGRSSWAAYVEDHSGLPGPRANTSLVAAVARVADEDFIDELLEDGSEFQAMCAAAAIAYRAQAQIFSIRARALASDVRWRVREGVAIGLQLLGDEELSVLVSIVVSWADDPDPLVQRAGVAAICEPRLLRTPEATAVAIEVCRRTTGHLASMDPASRSEPNIRALRQALGYCWSVAVAADPRSGLSAFRSLDTHDPDIAWIVNQNLRKARLAKLVEQASATDSP